MSKSDSKLLFRDFLSKIESTPLIESVKAGFSLIFESESSPDYINQYRNKLSEKAQNWIWGHKSTDSLIDYMKKYGIERFNLPTTEEDQAKLFSIMFPYLFEKGNIKTLLSRLPYYKEYEGKSIDDIEESAKEDQADLIDSFNDSIASKLSLYEKGKQIILAKAKANIAPPNIPAMVSEIIDNSGEENESNYAFIRIYGKDPENDIGVAVDTTTGKIEISDENEEADPELLDAVTALISDPEAYETVYSSQNESLCQRIIDSNKVPANMFFSKNKRYAQGYLQDGRDIITFKIQNKYISRHSDVDWMSRSEAPVMNARYL